MQLVRFAVIREVLLFFVWLRPLGASEHPCTCEEDRFMQRKSPKKKKAPTQGRKDVVGRNTLG